MVTLDQNKDMKEELKAQEDVIVELQNETRILKGGQEALLNDITRLDDIANYKQTVIIRERELDNDLASIPETEDRPFADPNNFNYAKRLRQHQQETLDGLTPNQPD